MPLRGRQIFIATHSPWLFKNCLEKVRLIIARRRGKKISFKNTEQSVWLFLQPSWGEISFHAYDLQTFEYHNELYGWIQEKTTNWDEESIDKYFQQQGNLRYKTWVRLNKNGSQKRCGRTIMTYIRNFTHHPENTLNQKYSNKELRQSILAMIKIVKTIV